MDKSVQQYLTLMSGSYNLNIFRSKKEEKEKKKKKNEKNMEDKEEKVENDDPQPFTSAQVDESQKKKKKKKNKFKIQHDEISSTTVDPSSELLSHMKSHQMRKYLLVKAGGEALDSQVIHMSHRGFRPGPIQTGLYSYKRLLEA